MLKLVETYEEIVRNAKEFHGSINDKALQKKLSQFRHWYYIEEINGFAPSKFIGYKNVTFEEYNEGTKAMASYMDGRDTVRQLKEWFTPINDQDFEYYYKELKDFLMGFDKKPNKIIHLHYRK
jgi:hypothetical protein